MKSSSDRRQFLKLGLGGSGLILFSSSLSQAFASVCGLTPAQTAGPFYPGEQNFHPDNDLTIIAGHTSKAQGQVVYIKGQVLDSNCKAVSGAQVEIWQACASGKYNHKNDTNSAPLDSDFKYWGETVTDADGNYIFKTILPGAYPADADWTRPPHVHFKISKLGYKELITQLYFKGNPLNEKDLILQGIPEGERDRVVVDFQPAPANFEPQSLIGIFDITLTSVRYAGTSVAT